MPDRRAVAEGGRQVSAAEDRYLMTVIATASNPRFSVSRVDIDRAGPTYTIDTLRDLAARRPDADSFFITGADALAGILSWKDVDELFELAHFVGVTRPGLRRSATRTLPRGPRHAWSRCRPWRSPPPTAGRGSPPGGRSGTSCPTVSSSTSPSAASTGSSLAPADRRRPRWPLMRGLRCHDRNRPTPRELATVAARAAADKLAARHRRARRQRPARHHRRRSSSPRHQRTPGRGDRRRDRGASCARRGAKPVRREGERDGRWVLLDYVDIVVHVQHAEERVFYALERLWKDCPSSRCPTGVAGRERDAAGPATETA